MNGALTSLPIKESLRSVGGYTLSPVDAPVHLHRNESSAELAPEIREEILADVAGRSWRRYPPFSPTDLLEALAARHGLDPEGILFGNGSNELLAAALAATVRRGDPVVVPEPTFLLYHQLVQVHEGRYLPVRSGEDLVVPAERVMTEAREAGARVVVLCTPNNPTGATVGAEAVRRIHDSTEALVIADQAYAEYGGDDLVPLLAECPRLVVTRTFSKAFSLGGVRAGYMMGDPPLIREIGKAQLPYAVGVFAETAVRAVLRHLPAIEAGARRTAERRDRIVQALQEIPGVQPWPGAGNFVLFRVRGAGAVFERLAAEHGVLVRNVSGYPMLHDCLRVTVGTEPEMERFLNGLRAITQSQGAG